MLLVAHGSVLSYLRLCVVIGEGVRAGDGVSELQITGDSVADGSDTGVVDSCTSASLILPSDTGSTLVTLISSVFVKHDGLLDLFSWVIVGFFTGTATSASTELDTSYSLLMACTTSRSLSALVLSTWVDIFLEDSNVISLSENSSEPCTVILQFVLAAGDSDISGVDVMATVEPMSASGPGKRMKGGAAGSLMMSSVCKNNI